MLGLPEQVIACLFDLDGVLTQTAKVHTAAWRWVFDDFLRSWADRHGQEFVPFDPDRDYRVYVDGRPRADGVRTFLRSRGIVLPDGAPDDPVSVWTVNGLGNRKNEILRREIRANGVQVYAGSVAYLRAARAAGLRRGVVSASANCQEVLVAAGIQDLMEVRVDGKIAAARGLRGKPHPDTFLFAATLLGVAPRNIAVFEDAISGVQAARAGGFGVVVGVDRVGQADALSANGASMVVADLAELLDRASA